SGASEQKRVRDAPLGHGIFQCLGNVFLPHQIGKGLWTPLASQNKVAHARLTLVQPVFAGPFSTQGLSKRPRKPLIPRRTVCTRSFSPAPVVLCAVCAVGLPAPAVDPVDWPQGSVSEASGQDPIAALRWSSTVAWTTTQPASVEPLLRTLNNRLRVAPESAQL